jgi:hypothetical protein
MSVSVLELQQWYPQSGQLDMTVDHSFRIEGPFINSANCLVASGKVHIGVLKNLFLRESRSPMQTC